MRETMFVRLSYERKHACSIVLSMQTSFPLSFVVS